MRNFKKKVKEKFINFFDWVNGAELVELNSCNTQDDPVRPELDMKFRTSYGRKISSRSPVWPTMSGLA